MTRFAWLQSRVQYLACAVMLAAFAVVAALTGVHLSHLFHSIVVPCHGDCSLATTQFLTHDHFMDQLLDISARMVPALIGIFWGAPLLSRELETGTFRLAWTQTVTRRRWTLTKLGLGALATVVFSGLVTLTITWWYRALDPVASNKYAIFDRRDVVPIGYALFAFAAGALIGVVVRRTVPAMAATLGVFIFGRVAISTWVRPHLLGPVTRFEPLASAGQFGVASANGAATAIVASGDGPANSWTLSSHLYNASGGIATFAERTAFVREHCASLATVPTPPIGQAGGHAIAVPVPGNGAGQACLDRAAHAFRLTVTYLPVDRYWALQWAETGVFAGLAFLCGIACYWWVTRRAV